APPLRLHLPGTGEDAREGAAVVAPHIVNEEVAMLRQVRRVRRQRLCRVVVGALLALVVFTGSAAAECAWVLWNENDVKAFDRLGRQDKGSVHSWDIVLSTSDEQLCWKGVFEKAKAGASRRDMDIPGFPGLVATVEATENSVTRTYRRPEGGAVIFVGISRWVGVPDTIARRGRKGGGR